jgi:hypothetical protein
MAARLTGELLLDAPTCHPVDIHPRDNVRLRPLIQWSYPGDGLEALHPLIRPRISPDYLQEVLYRRHSQRLGLEGRIPDDIRHGRGELH